LITVTKAVTAVRHREVTTVATATLLRSREEATSLPVSSGLVYFIHFPSNSSEDPRDGLIPPARCLSRLKNKERCGEGAREREEVRRQGGKKGLETGGIILRGGERSDVRGEKTGVGEVRNDLRLPSRAAGGGLGLDGGGDRAGGIV